MYEKEKGDIKALTDAAAKIQRDAQRLGRGMNSRESEMYTELMAKAEEIQRTMPHDPVTMPGPYGSGSGVSGGPFNSLGEQMAAVAASSRPGAQVDPRLWEISASTGLGETTPSDGGFLVQSDFVSEIFRNVYDSGEILKRCRRIQLTTNANSVKINGLDESSRADGSRWGGVRSYWVAEAGQVTASRPKFRQIELELKKQAVLIYVTEEMLQDSSVLQETLTRIASDELRFALENAIISGTGAGQPLGILNAGSLVTVDKEDGQTGGTFVYENCVRMWSRLIGKARQNSVWLVNQNVEPQLYQMSLAVGTGGVPVFMPAGGASNEPYSSLFGRPIIPCEFCSTLGTKGDVILGSFQDGYVVAEKGGIRAQASIHVNFAYDEQVFKFVLRVDGQPVLANAITPFSGTDTQSHFVALESRTS